MYVGLRNSVRRLNPIFYWLVKHFYPHARPEPTVGVIFQRLLFYKLQVRIYLANTNESQWTLRTRLGKIRPRAGDDDPDPAIRRTRRDAEDIERSATEENRDLTTEGIAMTIGRGSAGGRTVQLTNPPENGTTMIENQSIVAAETG